MGGWRKATPAEVAAIKRNGAQRMVSLVKLGSQGTPSNPIANEIELAVRLQELCGAEGYRIEGGMIIALRWDLEGNEVVIDRFEAVAVNS